MKRLRTLMYRHWGMGFGPLYFAEPADKAPPTVVEGFDIASLQGDAWQGIIQANEGLKENPVALNTKGPMDAIEQLINANGLLGQDRLPAPKDDWTAEQWASHHTALGRPEAATDYTLENAPEIPGFELSDDFMKTANEAMFEAGLNGKQHGAVMDSFFGWLKSAGEATEAATTLAKQTATDALTEKYGSEMEGKVAQANAVIAEFASPEYAKQIEESGQGNDPGFIAMMMKVAEQFGEDTPIGEAVKSNLSGENAAIKKIAELKVDTDFTKKMMDENAVGHKEAVAQWHELHKKAYPGAQTS